MQLEKQALRQFVREEKRRYSQDGLCKMSQRIISRVLHHPKVAEAETILMYWSLPDEVDTHKAITELHRMGKTVLLPRVASETELTLHRYEGADCMATGAYGISEPITPALREDALERGFVCIVPGMAFDRHGNRLGRGKGYYDRLLGRCLFRARVYIIGICFPFQMVDEVPTASTDIRMDEVISN